jgi:hypothetical protein
MRIDNGGTPTYFTARHGKGISLIQGRSNVKLSNVEARGLLKVLGDLLTGDGQEVSGLDEG